MLRDHRQLMVTFADKIAVREHVAAAVGEHVLPVMFHALDDPRHFAEVTLPSAFVLKPTHGSGVAIIVSELAEPEARLPYPQDSWTYRHVRPEHARGPELVAIAGSWLSQLYGQGLTASGPTGTCPDASWSRSSRGADGGVPDDYKFFVFHGTCRYISVDRGRFARRTQDFFTPDWTHVPLSGGPPWADPPIARPERLAEMLGLAELLGQGTDFVRVDLYDLPDRVVFGELSSLPAGGDSPFEPESFNLEFGSHWTPPRRYL